MIDALARGLNPDHHQLVIGMLGMFVAFFLLGVGVGLLLSYRIRP